MTQDLPLRVGKPFNLARLQMSIDTVTLRLRNLGYPTVDIFREFASDSATRTGERDAHGGDRAITSASAR